MVESDLSKKAAKVGVLNQISGHNRAKKIKSCLHETTSAYNSNCTFFIRKMKRNCSIPNLFNNHACKGRNFTFQNETLNASERFVLFSEGDFFFLRTALIVRTANNYCKYKYSRQYKFQLHISNETYFFTKSQYRLRMTGHS